jgi:hypothetical protein
MSAPLLSPLGAGRLHLRDLLQRFDDLVAIEAMSAEMADRAEQVVAVGFERSAGGEVTRLAAIWTM